VLITPACGIVTKVALHFLTSCFANAQNIKNAFFATETNTQFQFLQLAQSFIKGKVFECYRLAAAAIYSALKE